MQKQFVAMKAFIVNEENDTIFLMKKGNKDLLNPGKWEIPGGKMEFGETPTDTILREVKEESGLDIEVGDEFTKPWQWTFTKPNGDENQIIAIGIICKAKSYNMDFSHQTDTDNLVQGEWVKINEILNYDLIPNLIPTMQDFVEKYNTLKITGTPIFKPRQEQPLYYSNYTVNSKKNK